MTKTYCAMVALIGAAACGGNDKPAEDPSGEVSASAEADAELSADTSNPAKRGGDNDTEVSIDGSLSEACGLSNVKLYFPFDSAEVKGDGEEELKPLADCLTNGKLSGRALRVVGYADPRGTQEYNKDLAKSRAENIADLLKNAGVPEGKLETKSEGESESSDEPKAWPRDRRVELYLVED
jgi:outer membrane protein OmpA-like peptidoglycan-associated protein